MKKSCRSCIYHFNDDTTCFKLSEQFKDIDKNMLEYYGVRLEKLDKTEGWQFEMQDSNMRLTTPDWFYCLFYINRLHNNEKQDEKSM